MARKRTKKRRKPGKARKKTVPRAALKAISTKPKFHTIPHRKIIRKSIRIGLEREKAKKSKKAKEEHFHPNVPGFNGLLPTGIPAGSSILVEGGPGSGKTIFCLQSAYNLCKDGKRVLYMSFEEPEERLVDHMKKFGWDVAPFIKSGKLVVKRFDALDISRSVEALLSEAKKELLIDVQPILIPPKMNPDIIFVDSLTSIASAFSGEENRFRIYMEQMFRYLEKQQITSFLIREVSNPTHIGQVYSEKYEAVSFLSDGIIIIYSVFFKNGSRGSAIEVLKMRGTHINKKIVRMDISNRGLKIYPTSVIKGHISFT